MDQLHRTGPDFGRELVGRLACHGSTFSGVGASDQPGAVHHDIGKAKSPALHRAFFAVTARPGCCLSGETSGVGRSRQGPERRPEKNARTGRSIRHKLRPIAYQIVIGGKQRAYLTKRLLVASFVVSQIGPPAASGSIPSSASHRQRRRDSRRHVGDESRKAIANAPKLARAKAERIISTFDFRAKARCSGKTLIARMAKARTPIIIVRAITMVTQA